MNEAKERTDQLWDVSITVPHPDHSVSVINGDVWVPEELGAMQAIVAFAAKHGADSGTLRHAEAQCGNCTRTVRGAAPSDGKEPTR